MTDEEISKIKEHIEIHARQERRAIRISEILWKAVDELERITELEKENTELQNKLKDVKNYLAYDIPHGLINEATNKIWHML